MKKQSPEQKANKDFERQFKAEIEAGAFIPRRLAGAFFKRRLDYWRNKK